MPGPDARDKGGRPAAESPSMRGSPPRQEEPKEQLPAVEGIITDVAEVRLGDRVIYPNQGVCRIVGMETREISGQRLDLVRMEREEDGATVMVPHGKLPAVGLRKVASAEQIEGVFHYLAAQYDDPELDWKIRHRDNADRLIAGGVLGVAEVVKGLHALSRLRPLPAKEREQYNSARHLLVHEIAVSLSVEPAFAEDYIDYALMPPAGVTFKLKPPPKPVELPPRTRRRIPRADDDGLEIDALTLDDDLADATVVVDAAAAVSVEEEAPVVDADLGRVPAAKADEGETESTPAELPEEAELPGDVFTPRKRNKMRERHPPKVEHKARAKAKPAKKTPAPPKPKPKPKPKKQAATKKTPARSPAPKPAAKKTAAKGKKK